MGRRLGRETSKKTTPADAQVSEGDTIVTNTDTDGLGHLEFVTVDYSQQSSQPLPIDLEDRVSKILNKPNTDCAAFIKKLIGNLKKAHSDDPMTLFKRVEFKLGDTGKYAGLAGITSGKREVTIHPVSATNDPKLSEHQAYAYAMTALNELMHHAKESGVYSDHELSLAIFPLLSSELQAAHPLPKTKDRDTNSTYFHSLFNLHCRSLTGE